MRGDYLAGVARLSDIVRRPLRFALRVFHGFRKNHGFLLAGAVAYNSLLSIVPLLTLLLLALSAFMSERLLLETIETHLDLVIPTYSKEIVTQIEVLLAHREVVSGVVVFVLLFFSAIAFGVLENAMAAIFHHRLTITRRNFVVSALLPYVFITLLGLGIVLVSLVSGAFQNVEGESVTLFGHEFGFAGISGAVLYLLGVLGVMSLLTAFYLVMPVGKIAFRHAIIGGVTAGILWEATRRVLAWYFETLSLVNVVYGSLAGTVVVLLSFEIGALILLLGAQVIAELERRDPET